MPKVLEGELSAGKLNFGIVVARFNSFITERLLHAAVDTLVRHGATEQAQITVAWVPGSFELGIAAKKMASSGSYGAVICLGCVIRGATTHYDCVVDGATRGVMQAGLDTGVPVIFGVITADNLDQAIERAGTKMGNIGASAAAAGIEMANLMKKL